MQQAARYPIWKSLLRFPYHLFRAMLAGSVVNFLLSIYLPFFHLSTRYVDLVSWCAMIGSLLWDARFARRRGRRLVEIGLYCLVALLSMWAVLGLFFQHTG